MRVTRKRTLKVNSRIKAKLNGYTRGFLRVSKGYFLGSSEIRRPNNFNKDEILFAKGGSINFISNDFSIIESLSLKCTAVFDIIEDI